MTNKRLSALPSLLNPSGNEDLYVTNGFNDYRLKLSNILKALSSTSITKIDLGLDQVNNTSSLNKPVSTITGSALSDKASIDYVNTLMLTLSNIIHTHTVSDITDFLSEISSKITIEQFNTLSDLIHTHEISEINNLRESMDGKALTTHTHPELTITKNVYVQGPTQVTVNEEVMYKLNHFDSFTDVSITAINGSVRRDPDATVFYYTAPSSPGVGSFIVDTKRYDVDVIEPVAVWAERAILSASNKAEYEWYSNELTISGDGTRCAVSCRYKNNGNGVVYIYKRSDNVWIEENILSVSIDKQWSYFGTSLSMDTTGTRLAVGSQFYETDENNKLCKAYIFLRTGTSWILENELVPDAYLEQAYFSDNLVISGDGTRCVVGRPVYITKGEDCRDEVYIFLRTGSTWTREFKFTNSSSTENSYIGWSLAITDNGDRVIIGASNVEVSGIGQGAGEVYILSRSGTTWTQEALLRARESQEADYFGYGIDVSADGTRCVLGAPYGFNVSGLYEAGKVYIYKRSGTTWTEEAILTASDQAVSDWFGEMVSISADGSRIIVSSGGADPASISMAGKVYIYLRTGTTWTEEVILTASDKSTDDYLGWPVAMTDDGTKCLVGSSNASSSGLISAGQAYYFSLE